MTPKHETADEWAKRVLDEHGPPPQHVIDHVGRLRAKHKARMRAETAQRKRTA